jgi:ribosomal protein L31E
VYHYKVLFLWSRGKERGEEEVKVRIKKEMKGEKKTEFRKRNESVW